MVWDAVDKVESSWCKNGAWLASLYPHPWTAWDGTVTHQPLCSSFQLRCHSRRAGKITFGQGPEKRYSKEPANGTAYQSAILSAGMTKDMPSISSSAKHLVIYLGVRCTVQQMDDGTQCPPVGLGMQRGLVNGWAPSSSSGMVAAENELSSSNAAEKGCEVGCCCWCGWKSSYQGVSALTGSGRVCTCQRPNPPGGPSQR